MPLYYACGSPTTVLTEQQLRDGVREALAALGERNKVALIPPDFTRYHSRAGIVAQEAYSYYGDAVTDVIPALGTHAPMTDEQLTKMFTTIPKELVRVHDWRNDVVTIGHVPREMVLAASDGQVDEPWPAQINKLIWEGGHDLVLSIGQVVPHEVMGMANYNKNMFVGIGGSEAINFSHFIGAVYGMERMMGRANNPLRQILNYASDNFLNDKIPVVYVQTVVGRDETSGELVTRGLFVGDDAEVFNKSAALSLEVNFTMLDAPLDKVVVYLDPEEYHSTWLGNKSIYRTRMAIADAGQLVVLAPGVRKFGEDNDIDLLIRRFGYKGTPETLAHLRDSRDLMRNLSAAAHLIHGSTEGRFNVTYCPGHLTQEEVEGVGYEYMDLTTATTRYNPDTMTDGFNEMSDGEHVFYISNPAVGLWAYRGFFEASEAVSSVSTSAEPLSVSGECGANNDPGVGGGPFVMGEGQ